MVRSNPEWPVVSVDDPSADDVAFSPPPWPRSCRPHQASASSIVQAWGTGHFLSNPARSRAVCGRRARDFSRQASRACSSSSETGFPNRSDGATDNAVKYLEIVMEHVVISNYSVSGGPGDVPVENVSLSYGKVQYTYKGQKEDTGKADGNEPVSHDLITNKVA